MYGQSHNVSIRQLHNEIAAFRKSFSKPMTQKEWIKNAARVWEAIKKSPIIMEYKTTMQKMQLFKS